MATAKKNEATRQTHEKKKTNQSKRKGKQR